MSSRKSCEEEPVALRMESGVLHDGGHGIPQSSTTPKRSSPSSTHEDVRRNQGILESESRSGRSGSEWRGNVLCS